MQVVRAVSERTSDVGWIVDSAVGKAHAAAADARGRTGAQSIEQCPALVERCLPHVLESLPVGGGRRAVGRQLIERRLQIVERETQLLCGGDEGDAAQCVAMEPSLARLGASGVQQSARLVEPQRRRSDTGTGGELTDREEFRRGHGAPSWGFG